MPFALHLNWSARPFGAWLLILSLLFILACRPAWAHEGHAALPSKGATVQGEQLLLSPAAAQSIDMTTAKVELKDLSRHITVNAYVELPWQQRAVVTSLVPGKIEQVLARPGERVEAGQEIAHLFSFELEQLQSELRQVYSERELADRLAAQQQRLAESGTIAGKGLIEAETEQRQKLTEFEILRAKLLTLGVTSKEIDDLLETGEPLRILPIVAPISGIVEHADVRLGDFVEATDHLYDIVDRSTVWVVGHVLEADAALVKPGQQVKVTFDALPKQPFSGQVEDVDVHLDRERKTLPVRITIQNDSGRLRPGMFGRMKIEVQKQEQAIVLPTDTLIRRGGNTYVLLQQGPGKFVRRSVKVGVALPDSSEILDGLFPGDRVIQRGLHLLNSLYGQEPAGAGVPPKSKAKEDAPEVLLVNGTVELPVDNKAFASSPVQGRLSKIHVRHGQFVEAGQVLAEIESLEVQNLQLDLLQAETELSWRKQTLARLEGQNASVPRRQLWELQSETAKLESRVVGLSRQLQAIGLSRPDIERLKSDTNPVNGEGLSRTLPVRAPISGWLATFQLIPGQVVKREDQIFEVQDLSKVWIRGYVFEPEASRVNVGTRAVVTLPGNSGLRFNGIVNRISPVVNAKERALSIWVELDNPKRELKEEMSASLLVSLSGSRGQVAAQP